MKLRFRKKNRPPQVPPTYVRFIVDLPRDKVARGLLMRVDNHGPEIVQEEGDVLENLGTKLEILYDPSNHGCEYNRPWVVVFDVSFTWRGQSFGQEGPALVNECGLIFPNGRTPWAQDVKVIKDRIVWGTRVKPTAKQIVQVVQESQRQVEELMRDYWFNLKAELIRKPQERP